MRSAESLANLYRKVREQLYFLTEHQDEHEREWQTDEQERRRQAENTRRKAEWDAETEANILG